VQSGSRPRCNTRRRPKEGETSRFGARYTDGHPQPQRPATRAPSPAREMRERRRSPRQAADRRLCARRCQAGAHHRPCEQSAGHGAPPSIPTMTECRNCADHPYLRATRATPSWSDRRTDRRVGARSPLTFSLTQRDVIGRPDRQTQYGGTVLGRHCARCPSPLKATGLGGLGGTGRRNPGQA
jgi:hypothetical protein